MKWFIHSFKPYKSPGPDGITPAHIQQAGQLAINWLKKNLPLHPSGRRTTNSVARNEGGFHFQGREGHQYHSKGFKFEKQLRLFLSQLSKQ